MSRRAFHGMPLPLRAVMIFRRKFNGHRWFQCYYCNGIFIVGRSFDCSPHFEQEMRDLHEKECQ